MTLSNYTSLRTLIIITASPSWIVRARQNNDHNYQDTPDKDHNRDIPDNVDNYRDTLDNDFTNFISKRQMTENKWT